MFGQQNDQQQDSNQIPEQSIDGAMADAPATQNNDQAWQHPGAPLGDNHDSASSAVATAAQPTHDANNLIDIKQQALSQLSPLVNHLDQSPEEKFRTTMMMIQASDDQTLVQAAYDAAQKIEDEKVRAQALLDIVNEINYFTQHHDDHANQD